MLLREVPLYRAWYRVRFGWTFNDRVHPSLQKDPDWSHPERSMNAINDAHREFFTRYIRSEVGDRTDLLEQVVPTYPPFGKRMLMDNGWYRMLTNDNVELVTDADRQHRARHAVVSRTVDGSRPTCWCWPPASTCCGSSRPTRSRGRSGRTLARHVG